MPCNGCPTDSTNLSLAPDGRIYCQQCLDNRFFVCDGCARTVNVSHRERGNEETEGVFCTSCADDEYHTEINQQPWEGRRVYDDIRSQRKFGVELETSKSEGYARWLRKTKWGAKHDGSIEGMEFVSPPLYGDDGLASVMTVTQNMSDRGKFRVARSCGYHLHCDVSDTTPAQRKAITLAYFYTREVWHAFVEQHRHNNQYCWAENRGYSPPRPCWTRERIIESNDYPPVENRYIWVNWCAYQRHRTVEIRLHHASIDGYEVCNWVKAHLRFIDAVKDLSIAEITRIFGSKTKEQILAEMSFMWKDEELSTYYSRKSGIGVLGQLVTVPEEAFVAT